MPIPKVIHYCWFGGNELPASVEKCIRSWKRRCPDYEIKLWDENSVDVNAIPYTKEAYEAKAYAFVSDYFRLWIIYTYGGIYLDTDVEVVRNFDPLLNHYAFAGREGKEYVNFGLGFGAEKHHPLLQAHMELYEDIHYRNHDGSVNKTTLPMYTTMLLSELGFDPDNDCVQEVAGITVYPTDYFCPIEWQTGITRWKTSNTYSIHHYNASWFSEAEQEEKLAHWKECQREHRRQSRNNMIRKVLGNRCYELLSILVAKCRQRFGLLRK